MNIKNKTKNVFGYIRVSTPKQGQGVSLEVQKNDIIKLAKEKNLIIIKWFLEKKSASKGKEFRPEYTKMVAGLYNKQAEGFIAHKINRMMRHMDDWAELNHFFDKGYEIHSAVEAIDFSQPMGRYVANIQAANDIHYSQNLSWEAKKGLYGRLKQGYYPFLAPLGYIDNGGGKEKTIDPIKAPLVKQLFDLYIKQGFTTRKLVDEMYRRGLRNSRNNKVSKNSLIKILKNPFYMGIMEVKEQQFKGNHTPLITSHIFKKAQDIMAGKTNTKLRKHAFVFRKMLNCKNCGYKLIGELQKGNIYYRCHIKGCPTKSIRESTINLYIQNMLKAITVNEEEIDIMQQQLSVLKGDWLSKQKELSHSLNLRLGSLDDRLERITDLLIEGTLDKDHYESEKRKVLAKQQELNEQQTLVSSEKTHYLKNIQDFLELAQKPKLLYDLANCDEKRELLELLTSNLQIEGRKLVISMVSAFYSLVNRDVLSFGGDDNTSTLKKECTIVYSDINTSPIIPTPLDNAKCKEFLDFLLEEASSLPELNFPNKNELQTNNPNTK
jgi:DNA invertase Pin-like site-specific DNA recombinase